jgi:hypothetical protein
MDREPIPTVTKKVSSIVALATDYFSWLTGESYSMPDIRIVDRWIVGEHDDNPSTLVLGRRATKVIVLHELVHHLRGCNGISNVVYNQNPYPEEMAAQFVSTTVFSRSMDYSSVVCDIYAQTPPQPPKAELDLMAFQEIAYAIRAIVADRMDPGSEKTQRAFFTRTVYDLSRDRKFPWQIDMFSRFEYLRYPLGRGLGVLMYSKFLDTEETSKYMLLLTQSKLTELILSLANSRNWETSFFAVVSHLKKRLGMAQADRTNS